MDTLVALLGDSSRAVTPSAFLFEGSATTRVPGMYSWWVDESGALDLSSGLDQEINPGLIYVGQAGATRSGGRPSTSTLWGRVQGMHLGGRREFSTFRLTLASILGQNTTSGTIDEASLKSWMHDHLRINVVPIIERDSIDEVETAVLTALDPPLNLAKVPRTAARRNLSQLRAASRSVDPTPSP